MPTRRISAILASIVVLVMQQLVSVAQSPETILIGNRRQLLFDEKFVQQSKGVEFVVHSPRKSGDIIIASEPGWSLGGYHCAMHHAGVYHLWYTAGGCILYARSKDGIHWEKPNLGLLKDDPTSGLSVAPNVVLGRGVGGAKGGTHGLMVFLDPNAPDEEKFRLVCNPEEFNRMVQLFSSPDGIHWKHTHRDVITYRSIKPHHLDSPNVIFWDDRIKKYVAYFRYNVREAGSQGRSVGRAESPDFSHFPQVEDSAIVMRADKQYPQDFDPVRKPRISILDTYTNGTLKYPGADDAYFMFPTEYYHYTTHLAEFQKQAPVNAGALDTRFAASRDGIHWKRYDYRAFVGVGMKGEFDSRRVYMSYGVVPATNGRELYMYYLGTSETHGWNRDDKNNRLLTAAGLAPTGPSAISRVGLRRDGFVSVRAAYAGGEFTTPLLQFTGERLLLNVDTGASGEMRVEMLDEKSEPIPGYSLADCDLIHTTNEINRVVKWRGESDVKQLSGKPVRLRFLMRDVDLYAFQFAEFGNI